MDGSQVKYGQIFKSVILHKSMRNAHVSDSEFPLDSKYVINFPLRRVEIPKIASQKCQVVRKQVSPNALIFPGPDMPPA